MYQNAISDLLLNCAGTLVHFGAVNSGQWVGSCIRDHVIRRKIFSLSYQRHPRSSAAKIIFSRLYVAALRPRLRPRG